LVIEQPPSADKKYATASQLRSPEAGECLECGRKHVQAPLRNKAEPIGFGAVADPTTAVLLPPGAFMLEQLKSRLLPSATFEEAIWTVLDDSIALLGAEYGNVQLPLGGDLVIVAQRGLLRPFLDAFRRVSMEDGCACGRALRLGQSVIVTDVDTDPDFFPFLGDARSAGFRAVQSTPLLTRDRRFFGIVSTHFAEPHTPSDIEMDVLQKYGTFAADRAYQLLGSLPLAEKVQGMNDALYAELETAR
jgi:GAF domain-containing protein